ncbi:EmrB/QacA subfamily drug resistance transporter [Streptomyces aurantiacus]|uniref:MDR family MFS transporter n=1 Tax=Streptomyces aurantiacus TaxID=47760 RepID=UPI0027931D80|nr:MDR family MFS transporter [Streptomyces aurantiacus]MDQ0777176.1 EmrB/QacA subfamily drug resistance transporter [Streptomyces aurantiacus]
MSRAGASEALDPALKRTATAVVVGALAVVFDTTIVSVALDSLAEDLHTSVTVIQWVSTSYLLALGAVIPLAGWAQSRIGGKCLWITSLAIFLVGSVLCSLSWNAGSLIAFRVVQGIGGGMMLPLMQTLVVQAAKGKNLGKVMATMSLPTVLGPILGPVLGGLILNYGDWRWLFWVNVPFCLAGLYAAVKLLPKDPPPSATVKLDTTGLLLLSPAVVGLLYGLANSSGDGGLTRADVLVPALAGAFLLVGFVAWAMRRRSAALVDVRLFRYRPLAASATLLFLSGITLYGAMLLLPLYFQQVRGTDALGAGLFLIPQGVGTFLSRTRAGKLTDRIGARQVSVIGFAVVAASTLPFAFVTGSTNEVWLMAVLLLRGIGLGAVTIPLMTVAYVGMERADVPHASVIARIATQVGGSFGTAVLAVVLHSATGDGTTPHELAIGFDHAFWWATGFAAAGILLSLLLPATPDKTSFQLVSRR